MYIYVYKYIHIRIMYVKWLECSNVSRLYTTTHIFNV